MNMLSFSAEAALYKASGHYRTGRHALDLFRHTNNLRPALDEGEVIYVRDCRPGWLKLGEGVCVRDPSWPGGGGLPPGTPAEPGAEPTPPPGGGPGGEPQQTGKPTRAELTGKAWRTQCEREQTDPRKIMQCCDEKVKQCIKEAKGNAGREMRCSDASCWCLQQPGCV
jgi:hypothetical protein